MVYSYDPITGDTGYKKVRRLYIHDAYSLIKLTVNGEEVVATENHPFYVNGYGFERAAWENGIPVTNGKNWRVNKYDTTIGAVNGKETVYVRIENSSNTIHGHLISESEYNKLLK